MKNRHHSDRAVRWVAMIVTAANVSLCAVFFPLVPFLGWLNYGHGASLGRWIPDWVLLGLLPALYYAYWHFGLLFSLTALAACWALWRAAPHRSALIMAWANGASVVVYGLVRVVLAVLGIRPDSV